MANRLSDSLSPYLLQHADNPVDWWPWCAEAFEEARRREVPVLLSVGYAACHWCHVMAHESFEDESTAGLMNAEFVNIKVDREERPDVDAVYMEATQAMTGHGGWPMTVFCTPAGEPFFCGTYFPPGPRSGMPSFPQVLTSVATAWRERRAEIESVGAEVVRRLSGMAPLVEGGRPPTPEQLDRAVDGLASQFDPVRGGFGGAPKFPPAMVLEFLLRHHARTGSTAAITMVERTCDGVARGGIYDQLGGGFARYSVDNEWVVPHFEKMLYDNALLLRAYTHWWRARGVPLARRVALETAEWMLAGLRTPEGGFASALDADSEGVEGKYYVWTPSELVEVLGEDDGRWAAGVWQVNPQGTFEHSTSVLQLRDDPGDDRRYDDVRRHLRAARERRVPPERDDKVVASWNGLAIAALAEAGAVFERDDLVEAARTAADLLESVHVRRGAEVRLLRTSRAGRAGPNAGVLEDYADVAEGLLALYAVTGEEPRLQLAGELMDTVLRRFPDGHGGFFDTADDAEQLVRRPKDPTDNVAPSGQSAAAGALLTYAAYTGSARHRDVASSALGAAGKLAETYPRFAGWALAVAEALADGPREVAIVGPPGDPDTRALRRTALLATAPGAAVAVGDPAGDRGVPLLRDRPLVGGRAAAYVCRGFVCEAPTTDAGVLAESLGSRRTA